MSLGVTGSLPKRSMLAGMKILTAGAVSLLFCAAAVAATDKPKPIHVTLKGSDGKDIGMATLSQKRNGVAVKLSVHDVPAGLHGVHIHAKAVCDAPDFKTAGPHFNPTGKQHGFQNPAGHHLGDTDHNLAVTESHTASDSWLMKGLTLDPNGGEGSITANGGTALVIHQHADDEKTDPSGDSGNRMACGVIAAQ